MPKQEPFSLIFNKVKTGLLSFSRWRHCVAKSRKLR